MKRNPLKILAAVFFFLIVTFSVARAELLTEQTFTLHPGWNVIFLQVQPHQEKDPTTVFTDLAFKLPDGGTFSA